MNIIFYSTSDGQNVINKTLTKGVTIPLFLKRETDVNNPVLILSNIHGLNYHDFNYCYIDSLKRFYFIQNVRQLSGVLFQVELSCDVLETYKTQILASKARFKRGIKTGDFHKVALDESNLQSITSFKGDVTIDLRNQNYILTSLGV